MPLAWPASPSFLRLDLAQVLASSPPLRPLESILELDPSLGLNRPLGALISNPGLSLDLAWNVIEITLVGWSTSKKLRMQHKKLLKHLTKQEAKWRARVEEKVKVFSPAEIEAYCLERGLPLATKAST